MSQQSQKVVKITTSETYPLRIAVLRDNTPSSDPKFAEDELDGTIHLGIFDESKTLIGTSTWVIKSWQNDPQARAIQLRGMAVAKDLQGSGLGKSLVEAGVAYAKSLNAKYVWAKARDTAMVFYLANGFSKFGERFTEGVTQLPHHLVVREI